MTNSRPTGSWWVSTTSPTVSGTCCDTTWRLGRFFAPYDHRERNHQGLDNQLLQRPPPPVSLAADVQRRERLGGWLNFYHREAA